MPKYRNVGPPWQRNPTQVVPHGGVFVATEREDERIRRRGLRARFELVRDTSQDAANADASLSLDKWPLRMKPKIYLKLHPQGQYAALARDITGG